VSRFASGAAYSRLQFMIDEVHIMFHAAKNCPALFDLVHVVRPPVLLGLTLSTHVSPHNFVDVGSRDEINTPFAR